MSNEEYQSLFAHRGAELRERFLGRRRRRGRDGRSPTSRDDELAPLVQNLGGHDLDVLLDAYRACDAVAGPPERRVRLHRQGLGPADRRRPAEPRRPAVGRADRRAAAVARADAGRPSGTASTPTSPEGQAVRGDGRRAEQRPRAAAAGAPDPRRHRRARRRADVDAGVVRAHPHPPRRRRRGRRAHRDDVARRQRVDEPRRLDQQGRRVRPGRGDRLPRRGPPAALAAVAGGPAHRARHQRDEPVPAAARARSRPRPARRAPAADRHGLRPVRVPRPRRPDLRPLLRARGSSSSARRPGSRWPRRAAPTSRRSRRRSGSSCPA